MVTNYHAISHCAWPNFLAPGNSKLKSFLIENLVVPIALYYFPASQSRPILLDFLNQSQNPIDPADDCRRTAVICAVSINMI